MRKSHEFPDNVVRVPKNAVGRRIHFDLLKIKASLADPRIWVGHYQYEDIVYSADSNGGITFSKICMTLPHFRAVVVVVCSSI